MRIDLVQNHPNGIERRDCIFVFAAVESRNAHRIQNRCMCRHLRAALFAVMDQEDTAGRAVRAASRQTLSPEAALFGFSPSSACQTRFLWSPLLRYAAL